MNTDKSLLKAESQPSCLGAVSGSLSFDDALALKMNWGDVIRYWKPNATDEECQSIYDEMYKLAYKDGVLGRRDHVNEGMIFDRIKYTQFRELNCH